MLLAPAGPLPISGESRKKPMARVKSPRGPKKERPGAAVPPEIIPGHPLQLSTISVSIQGPSTAYKRAKKRSPQARSGTS